MLRYNGCQHLDRWISSCRLLFSSEASGKPQNQVPRWKFFLSVQRRYLKVPIDSNRVVSHSCFMFVWEESFSSKQAIHRFCTSLMFTPTDQGYTRKALSIAGSQAIRDGLEARLWKGRTSLPKFHQAGPSVCSPLELVELFLELENGCVRKVFSCSYPGKARASFPSWRQQSADAIEEKWSHERASKLASRSP